MANDKDMNKLAKPLDVIMAIFIVSSMVSGCATTSNKYSMDMTCPVCKKEMVHIVEKLKDAKIHCETCGSDISETGNEHYCTNCGSRIENFSVKVPF